MRSKVTNPKPRGTLGEMVLLVDWVLGDLRIHHSAVLAEQLDQLVLRALLVQLVDVKHPTVVLVLLF